MEKMSKPFAYLACPYSHQDSWRRIARFRAANKAAAELLLAGVNVYSPISHSHPLTEEASLPWQTIFSATVTNSGGQRFFRTRIR
jgi:hypothetical protein